MDEPLASWDTETTIPGNPQNQEGAPVLSSQICAQGEVCPASLCSSRPHLHLDRLPDAVSPVLGLCVVRGVLRWGRRRKVERRVARATKQREEGVMQRVPTSGFPGTRLWQKGKPMAGTNMAAHAITP